MALQKIIDLLPYSKPFLFVDGLDRMESDHCEGHFTFPKDSFFYEGHFKDYPVTPGVILTECMAQIGVVCLGIYNLLLEGWEEMPAVAMTSSEVSYLKPVFPEERVRVLADKQYFRFGKIQCDVQCLNAQEELVCKGVISGMIVREHAR
ncbi:FabA/FabZ family ACP-dehydratase [Flavobacteriaceae bacterium YJPT1-3]|nr:FabA/FabZ family ACP-dehydratase [Flavobacteriaceae bacterium YJPT1-3]